MGAPSDSERDEDAPDYTGVAVLLPCFNEGLTIGKVVADFEAALPGATIYVFDNASTDDTAEVAKKAGATVVHSPDRGKGNVVRHMFDVVDADTYLMADGDDTYPASEAPMLLRTLEEKGADMVVGARIDSGGSAVFRRFHRVGNGLVTGLISRLFRAPVSDVLSGYRAFSRALVKTLPLCSSGFSIETELTLQVLTKRFVIAEARVPYGARPEGSVSKLNTFSDGALVLKVLFMLFKDYKPMALFGWLAVLLAILSLSAGALPILDYVEYRYVYHVPLAILAAGIGILATISFAIGLILDTVARYHQEQFVLLKRLVLRDDEAGRPRR